MRKAILVCVVALAAAGAIIVITGFGRLFTLSLGAALVLAGVGRSIERRDGPRQ